MTYESKLKAEINAVLDHLQSNNLDMIPQFVANQIINEHVDTLPDDESRDFWLHCGYSKTREMVTRCINRRLDNDGSSESSQQHVLPGFDHLQNYYVVTREGYDTGLPIERISDAELKAKAKLYRSNGLANLAHSEEILRYLDSRENSEVA